MFQKFDYSKDWRNPTDFPTVEADETQVRADMQLLFTEARNAVWALVEALADQSAAANIGAEDGGKTVTLQSLLEALRLDEHRHENLSGLEDLVTAFAGLTLATSITNDDTKIPTSKAIYDYIVKIGGGDMMTAIYDPAGKTKDIFAYAEEVTAEHANKKDNPHNVTAEQLGLGNVDNTSDADKPVSTAVQEALGKKVNATDVIPIDNGGTGATTVAAARNALGLGNTSGAVPIANGGTGAATVAAARKNLGLGNTSGAVPVANGGTGNTSAEAALNDFINALPTGSSVPQDADYYVSQWAGGGTTTKTYTRRPMSALWSYIKGKIGLDSNGVLPVSKGGTGASTAAASVQNLFASGSSVTSYPTKPGIYRCVGTNVCTNSKSTLSGYGVLVIFQAVYGLHIYLDNNGALIYGYSGDSFAQPSFWYRVSAA